MEQQPRAATHSTASAVSNADITVNELSVVARCGHTERAEIAVFIALCVGEMKDTAGPFKRHNALDVCPWSSLRVTSSYDSSVPSRW